MPIKFCSEAYFSFFNEPQISDSGLSALSPSRRTSAQDFYVLKKSIDLSRVWTREPWISRRVRYPETTEADMCSQWFVAVILFNRFELLCWRHLDTCFFSPLSPVLVLYCDHITFAVSTLCSVIFSQDFLNIDITNIDFMDKNNIFTFMIPGALYEYLRIKYLKLMVYKLINMHVGWHSVGRTAKNTC